MNAVCLLVSVAVWLADEAPHAYEITEQRSDYLRASLRELQYLTERLSALGSPAKRLPDETADQYFDRVQQIYKARAQVLIVLHWEYEDALEARYALEADLKEYTRRLRELGKETQRHVLDVEQRRANLDIALVRLKNEGKVVGDLLYQAFQRRERTLSGKANRTAKEEAELAAVRGELARYKRYADAVVTVAGQDEIESRYRDKSVEELRTALIDLGKKYRDVRFERQFVETRVLNDTRGLLDEYFGVGSEEVVRQANELIHDSSFLEDRAAQVAIMAGYVRQDLELIAKAPDLPSLRARLKALISQEPIRERALRTVAGKASESSPAGLDELFLEGPGGRGPN